MKFLTPSFTLSLVLFVVFPIATLAADAGVTLNEQVVMIKKSGAIFDTELEMTIFKPDGDGPFPLIVINHGKEPGNPRFQPRARYLPAARALVSRGFVVALPMRSGFSKSGGGYVEGGCYVEGNGQLQADDVVAALDALRKMSFVDSHRIIIMGQSHGGLTTLAFGTRDYPGVLGLVNFAGGLREDGCPNWAGGLVAAFAVYGKDAKYPSLWFYGDNDQYWPQELFHRMYDAYAGAAHVRTKLIAYGTFKTNSHAMFSSADGLPFWLPEFDQFYASLTAGSPARAVDSAQPG